MASLLIVDDDADNARRLSRVLKAELPGDHDVFCAHGLTEFRRFRRQHKPALILVELLRQQSNGFTLAAALARQSSSPVVLLTDRDVTSDRIWASARGIVHVLSRRCGPTGLAEQLDGLLQSGLLSAGDAIPRPVGPVSLTLPRELTMPPETALLTCLAEELRQLPMTRPADFAAISTQARGPMTRLINLLPYISDRGIRQTLRFLFQPSETPCDSSWLLAREKALTICEPSAHSCLRAECREEWSAICQHASAEPDGWARQVVRCNRLVNALTFLPGTEVGSGNTQVGKEGGAFALIEYVERVLFALTDGAGIKTLVTRACLRVLAGLETDRSRIDTAALRELVRLNLMLRTVILPPHWQPALEAAVSALYDWKGIHSAAAKEQLVSVVLKLLLNPLHTTTEALSLKAATDACLCAEAAQKLNGAMAVISQAVTRKEPSHQRLSSLMVSVYKLRCWLEFGQDGRHRDARIPLRWRLVIGCLYNTVCHGVLQAERLTPADIKGISTCVSELQHCAEQQMSPPESTLLNLAALEVTLANRLQASASDGHQLLAAGLHRLPKPDCIVSDLLTDIKQSGTVLSEIIHELVLLTDGARRLGVVRVESLATLLLDCYQQLGLQPELLQKKPVRLALGRAHRVLCRLLDQAAAWLPMDQPGNRLNLPAVIDELFAQFDHAGSNESVTGSARHAGRHNDDGRAAWVRCQSLNRRLRQLIRHSGNLTDYRSLMIELLREQQAVIAPHLPYQSHG